MFVEPSAERADRKTGRSVPFDITEPMNRKIHSII
jgi:hypothetical protein